MIGRRVADFENVTAYGLLNTANGDGPTLTTGATAVFVPIDARVPVGDVAMFAVTVEPPGGVVVSTRERIALLASE